MYSKNIHFTYILTCYRTYANINHTGDYLLWKEIKSFSGQLGFVLAAAGSAVGVGNLWRFPYLAAKDGGGSV